MKVINSGIKWKGAMRKVNFWDKDIEEAEKKIGFEKVLTRPKGKASDLKEQKRSLPSPTSSPKSDTPKTKTGTFKTMVPAAPAGRTGRYDQAIYKQSQAAARRTGGGPGTQTQTLGGQTKP